MGRLLPAFDYLYLITYQGQTEGNPRESRGDVKEGGVKKLFIQNLDSHLVAPVVLLSCMERGADIMDPSSRTGRMVIAAVLLAALRIALLGG